MEKKAKNNFLVKYHGVHDNKTAQVMFLRSSHSSIAQRIWSLAFGDYTSSSSSLVNFWMSSDPHFYHINLKEKKNKKILVSDFYMVVFLVHLFRYHPDKSNWRLLSCNFQPRNFYNFLFFIFLFFFYLPLL